MSQASSLNRSRLIEDPVADESDDAIIEEGGLVSFLAGRCRGTKPVVETWEGEEGPFLVVASEESFSKDWEVEVEIDGGILFTEEDEDGGADHGEEHRKVGSEFAMHVG